MARMEVKQVLKRAQNSWTNKDNWRALHTDAYELALPMRNPYHGSGDGVMPAKPGQSKMDRLFDSTLMVSNVRLANRLQSEMTPPFMKWATLVPGPFVPESAREQWRKQLEPITDTVFAALQLSDFDTQVNEFYLELGIGTAVMMVLEGPDHNPLRFVTVPTSQVAIEPGAFGSVGAVFRRHTLEIHLIEEFFDGFDLKLPAGFEKRLKDNPNEKVLLEEATYFDRKDDIWRYDVIMKKGAAGTNANANAARIIEEDFDDTPYIVTRWIKVVGEAQGRGPVLFALPDAKTLNKLKELVLRNASIAVSGMWTAVNDGVLNPNNVVIAPGTVIPVARNGGPLGASLAPLAFGGNFDVSAFLSEDLIGSIKSIMMDDRLPDEEGPIRSATEFIMRQKQLQTDIGAPFGRLMSEFIRPLFQKSINILRRKGIVQQDLTINGGQVDVSVQSPLAQGQNLTELESAVQWMQLNQAMGPETFLLGTKVEEFAAWSAEKMGIDMALVREEDERNQMEGMAGQMLAMQQQRAAGPVAANDAGPVQAAA